jgi:galactokinase
VRIYRNDPLLGPLFNYALPKTIVMSDAEQTFRAVPYYFSGTPSLDWSVNGTQSQSGKDITVRSTGSGSGSALIGFTAKQAAANVLANTSMTVQFGAQKSLGIFGL